jgi:hypothetical protein
MAILEQFSGNHAADAAAYGRALESLEAAPSADQAHLDKVRFHHGWLLGEMKRTEAAVALFDGIGKADRPGSPKGSPAHGSGPPAGESHHAQNARLAKIIARLSGGERENLWPS